MNASLMIVRAIAATSEVEDLQKLVASITVTAVAFIVFSLLVGCWIGYQAGWSRGVMDAFLHTMGQKNKASLLLWKLQWKHISTPEEEE